MSLRVWLPLLSDAHNQGASDITPIVMGAGITYTAGKLGNAATFPNNCASCIHMPGLKLQVLSWCCWFKCTGEGSATSQRMLSEGRDTGSAGTNIWLSKAGTTLYWSAHKVTGSTTVAINTWYHVALTCDGSKVHLYLGGKEIGTGTAYSADSDYAQSNDSFVIGKMAYLYTTTGNYFPFCGQINDVRIYDHCLSAAEVKEIAQGLVLHYKLDNNGLGGKNLLRNSNFIVEATKDTPASGVPSSMPFTEDLQQLVGKTFTLSYEVYTPGARKNGVNGGSLNNRFGCHLTLKYTPSGGSQTTVYPCAAHLTTTVNERNQRLVQTYTVPSNCTINSFGISVQPYAQPADNNDAVWRLGKIKLEYGNKATSYSPALEDYGWPNDIIEDSSGYGHHATITNQIDTSSNTARYDTSAYFDGTSRALTITPGPNIINTLSCWCKTDKNKSTSQFMVADSGSNMCITFYSGTVIGVFGATRSTGSKSTLGASYKENDWNHIVVVKTSDDGQRDIYCNGVKLTPTTDDYWSAATGLWIGARNASQGYPFYGNISDVRAYATALSADDILELYHTSAKIDNLGGVHTFELVEGEGEHVYKNGVVESNNLLEEGVIFNKNTILSYKPAANATNSCAGNIQADFSDLVDLKVPISIQTDMDVSWTNMGAGTGGTFACMLQGANILLDGTTKWAGTNYALGGITNYLTTDMTTNATGSKHITLHATIPVSWFDTYKASNISVRTDYCDGNGTINLTNVQVKYAPIHAGIGSGKIKANEFIEK